MEVTSNNSGKANIECLIYFPYLFQGPNHLKNNKGANIIVCDIPCDFFYIESMIYQWKSNIEFPLFFPPPNP